MMSPADSALLLRWIDQRDPKAFKELASQYATMVYATCTRVLGDATEAEDVTQECFEVLAGIAEAPKGHLGAWLHRVAANRAIDRIRKEKRRLAREERYVATQDATTETGWDDIYGYVDQAIAELSEKQRGPLVAHYLEGQTHAHIAETLGMSRPAVTQRIAKGVDAVRDTLKRRGISVAGAALATMLGANLAEAASIPASLESTLGKLAVAGLKGPATAVTAGTTAATVGGLLMMKKVVIGAAIVATAALGTWMFTTDKTSSDPPESPAVHTAETQPTTVAGRTPLEPADTHGTPAEAPVSKAPDSATSVPGDEAAPEGAVITGQVFDANTLEGIVDAVVYAQRKGGGRGTRGRAKSDASGRFEITGLAEGEYEVGPSIAPGYPEHGVRGKWITVSLTQDQVLEDVDFSFEPGVRVSGTVVSADGEPVQSARVGAMTSGMPGAEHADTKRDGTFVIALREAGSDLVVQARNDEFETKLLGPLVLTSKGLDGLVLELTEAREGSILGIVVDSQGHPVERANIHLDRGKADYLIGSGGGGAETSRDGSFSIDNLASGEYGILLTPPDRETFSVKDEVTRVDLAIGQRLSGLRLVLGADKGGFAIAGRVVDTSGNPINGVEVSARGPVHEKADSGDDGSFTITGLAEGVYSLGAHQMAENAKRIRYGRASLRSIRAGTRDVEIVMYGWGTVEGRVLRADTGEPVGDFEVFFRLGRAERFSRGLFLNGEEVHHPQGQFSHEIESGWVTVTAKAPGLAPAFQSIEVKEHVITDGIELRLEPCSSHSGIVTNPQGEAVANAKIYLDRIPESLDRAITSTDTTGAFTIESISPETMQVVALHPDYAPGMTAVSEQMKIVLPKGGIIEGTMTSAGEALARNTLHVRSLDQMRMTSISALTNSDGSYRVSGVLPGRVEIFIGMNNRRTMTCQAIVEAGETTVVNLDFGSATCTIYGQLQVNDFAPEVMRVRYTAITENGAESREEDAAPDGSYRIENVPAGQVRLSAQIWSSDALAMKQFAEFELAEDETVQQNFDFSAKGKISGRLKSFDSNQFGAVIVLDGEVAVPDVPGPDFLASMSNMHEDLVVSQAGCDEGGAFVVEGLIPGTYTLLAVMSPKGPGASPEQMRYAVSVVEIKRDESVPLDFDFR